MQGGGGEGGEGGRSAGRPQGLLGRGQPISLSLINSSRGDCNTAGDCWEKRRREEGDEIGMNGAGEEGGRHSEDEEKIGKARKTGGESGLCKRKGGRTNDRKRWDRENGGGV